MVVSCLSHYLVGGDRIDLTDSIKHLISVGKTFVGIETFVECHEWKNG